MKQKPKSGPRFFKPAPKVKKVEQKICEVAIERLSDEGRGIGFLQGKVVFVAGALPGEKAKVRVLDEKRNLIEAELIELTARSAQRIEPGCPLFGRCGGCQLQMLDDSAQLAHKQHILAHLLKPVAENMQWEKPLTATPWNYRHRARLAVTAIDGQPAVGFKSANSHQVIPVPACPILDARLQPLLDGLPQWLAQLSEWRRVEEILIAVDANGQLALDWNIQRASPKADAEKFQALAQAAGVICGPHAVLNYTVPGSNSAFDFSVRDFTQVNPAINDQLVQRALEWLAPMPADQIADLFCGLGNFTLPLARNAQAVVGYEGSSVMVERARTNAVARSSSATFEALDLFEKAAQLPDRFNKVLLDPPRAGAKAVCGQLAQSKQVQCIVYVSCNPQTLLRDLGILTAGGFNLDRAALVDMFPQTGHCETLVQLKR
ncbi:MAG: TRAM domain-containing protein [Spongiibacteraceae bacterium]